MDTRCTNNEKQDISKMAKTANDKHDMRSGFISLSTRIGIILSKEKLIGSDVTKETGITSANVYNIINGAQTPTLPNLCKILTAINRLSGKKYKLDDLINIEYHDI